MMRTFAVALLAFCVSLAVAGPDRARAVSSIAGVENWNSAQIAWRDFPTGVREATSTRKPVLMVFQAVWCTACQKYRKVFSDPSVVEASKDFIMILVDVDKSKDINGAFSPDGTYVPRTLFLDFEGNIQDWLVGKDPQYPHTVDINKPDELLGLMKKAKERMLNQSALVE